METRWWRSWCHAGDDDDHGAPRWRSKELYDIGHIMSLLFDCMWCLSCFASYLLSTTVVNKMIPYNNFKKVIPLTVTIAKVRCFKAPRDDRVLDSNVHIQRVEDRFTHAKHLGWLDEPSMYRHGLGTQETERSNMSRMEDTINMEMFTNDD